MAGQRVELIWHKINTMHSPGSAEDFIFSIPLSSGYGKELSFAFLAPREDTVSQTTEFFHQNNISDGGYMVQRILSTFALLRNWILYPE